MGARETYEFREDVEYDYGFLYMIGKALAIGACIDALEGIANHGWIERMYHTNYRL
jgi:hypothetical protein